jgi:hypothetical protein
MRNSLFLLVSLVFYSVMHAQVGIGTTTPHNSALLDLQTTDKGVLVPRIALTAANSAAPVSTPADALLVYNTATAGSGFNIVRPGFYHWRAAASRWVPVGGAGTEDDSGFGAWGDGTPPAYVGGFNPVNASGGTTNAAFGQSVSISGNYAIIGAPNEDGANTDQGAAYIFYFNGNVWVEQQKLAPADLIPSNHFGYSVSMSGNYAIVGAPAGIKNSPPGAAYIFFFNGASWVQYQKLTASDGDGQDEFGYSVSISGNRAIVGAAYDNVGSNAAQGSAYIFANGGIWFQQTKLTAPDGTGFATFGRSVGISGDKVIVGADLAPDDPKQELHGAAYMFLYTGGSWQYLQKLTSVDLIPAGIFPQPQHFGISVGISGNYAVVGGPGILNSGRACVYAYSGTTWKRTRVLFASDGAELDQFGMCVSISGDYAIAGAYSDAIGLNTDQGSAYVFKINGPSEQIQKISDPSGNAYDLFGISCSIYNGQLAVGALQANSSKGMCYFGKLK